MNKEEKKKIEQKYITKYMKEVYKVIPKYIQSKIDIPDGYFIVNDEYWAVEATSYYMDEIEANWDEVKNILKKYNNQSENIFKQCFNHIGKRKVPHLCIRYGDINQLIKDLVEAEEYILNILCNGKYWTKKFNYFVHNNGKYTLENFIKNTLKEASILNITLNKKFNYNVNIRLHYSKIFNKREISENYVWWENKDKYIDSILDAIKKKIDKYDEYIIKIKNSNQSINKYCLVIHPIKIPIEIDKDILEKAIKKEIKDIKYDEIAIHIWNNIVLIKNNQKGIKK